MPWYRTHGGRLIHGSGGLAAVYVDRGWAEVDDETALAETGSGEAQTRADVESDLAGEVDAATLAAEKTHPGTGEKSEGIEAAEDGTEATVEISGPERGGLLDRFRDLYRVGDLEVDTSDQTLTPEQQAEVDAAVRDEGYGG